MSLRSSAFWIVCLLVVVLVAVLLWRPALKPEKTAIPTPPAAGPDSMNAGSVPTDSSAPDRERLQTDTLSKMPAETAPETPARPSERKQAASDTAVTAETPSGKPVPAADTAKVSPAPQETEEETTAEQTAARPDTMASLPPPIRVPSPTTDTTAPASPVPDLGKTPRPDRAIAPDTTQVTQAPRDTMAVLKTPADTTIPAPPIQDLEQVLPADKTIPPDTSGLRQALGDTMAGTEVPAEAPAMAADTTALLEVPSFISETTPSGLDVTEVSLPDTMIGKVYTARTGETMFTMERRQPFTIMYSYRFAGIEENAFRVDLITSFLDAAFRSSFLYAADGSEVMTIGPYDTRIEAVDSAGISFQLLGYTKLPGAEIPEPKEEIAQAREKEQEVQAQTQAQPQSQEKKSPSSPQEYFSRGYVQASAGKYDEARKDLTTSLQLDSLGYEARLLLGWILAEQNDSTAVARLRECQRMKPEDAEASYLLAYGLERDSSGTASELYTKLIEADSTNARALFRLASISRTSGDSAKAGDFLARARKIMPAIDSVSAKPALPDMREKLWWAEQMPRLIHFEEPVHPDSVQADSLRCTVEVHILVDEKGKPAEVKIGKPCDHPGFNEAAQAAARKCTFTPGMNNGQPASVWISQPFEFKPPEKAAEEELPEPTAAAEDTLAKEEVAQGGVIPPKLLKQTPPEYPLQKTRYRGTVTVPLQVLVGLDGSVAAVKFVPPDTFEAACSVAAEAAARQCLFQPGIKNGQPDTMWFDLPLTFNAPPRALPSTAPDSARTTSPKSRETPAPSDQQEKAGAFVQATVLAQQGKHDEALALVLKQLESTPKDNNAQMLYGLITLSKETGKRMEELGSFVQGTDQAYWWVDSMPQMKERQEAQFPEEAKGTALLYVLVDEKGAVQKTEVVISSGNPGLDAAAEEAAQASMFTPGTLQGEPARVWARLSYGSTAGD